MTRYFCDYCDTYLGHKSASARNQHNRGQKHRDAFKAYFQNVFMRQQQQFQEQQYQYGQQQQQQQQQHMAPPPPPM
jgi:hypothetical protein